MSLTHVGQDVAHACSSSTCCQCDAPCCFVSTVEINFVPGASQMSGAFKILSDKMHQADELSWERAALKNSAVLYCVLCWHFGS